MARRRSPIRASCKPWPFKQRRGERRRSLCQWVCDRPVDGAEFVNRRDPRFTAILHPSTKKVGAFQVSRFVDGEALGDVIRASCTAALEDSHITPGSWKLRSVSPLAKR